MEILNNKYVRIDFDEINSLAVAEWFAETENMSNEEYYQVFTTIGDLYKKYQVKRWLGNTLNFRMPVSPEAQEWTANNLTPMLIEAGLMKMAIVVPSEFFASLSVQQSVDEMESSHKEGFQTSYFDNVEKARVWILS